MFLICVKIHETLLTKKLIKSKIYQYDKLNGWKTNNMIIRQAKIEDVQVKEPNKKAKAETAKVPPKKKDLGNVLTRWASDDEQ